MRLRWETKEVPDELVDGLRALEEEYPISEGPREGAEKVRFKRWDREGSSEVVPEDGGVLVLYDGPARAFRAVGKLLAEDVPVPYVEEVPFRTLGIMLDCSRNAVPSVGHLKRWLRKMALMGYDMMMLYMEDTYEVPGEPFFGYLRGRYSQEELREVDSYASKFGIEVIPCIQTLGHLEQILRWPAYRDVKDTSSVLLAGGRTYELLERMIRAASEPFRTDRIHVGMDEAHDLGRGRYLDTFGYRRNFEIFSEHLSEVIKICRRLGLRPMIWSDMYFRMGSETGDYYDPKSVIPEEVVAKIPEGVQLVYWDYYHRDEEFYREWIRRHRRLGRTPIMASGIWTWNKLWYDHTITTATVAPCLSACRKEGVEEVFFTLWGDDGAECERDSALAGLMWAAELAYGGGGETKVLVPRFKAICGGDYVAHIRASEVEYPAGTDVGSAKAFLWDDPLLGMFARYIESKEVSLGQVAAHYRALAQEISRHRKGWDAGDTEHIALAAKVLADKVLLRGRITAAYAQRDRAALQSIAQSDIPALQEEVRKLWESHRRVWLSQNKPFGFEVLTVRYGGLIMRLEEIRARIEEYVSGRRSAIEELEEPAEPLPQVSLRYRNLVTSSAIL